MFRFLRVRKKAQGLDNLALRLTSHYSFRPQRYGESFTRPSEKYQQRSYSDDHQRQLTHSQHFPPLKK